MPRTGRPRAFDREQALLSAMKLFWRQGYEPTSLNQLKETMGNLSPTSFYAAFGSKERLFREVVDRYRSSYGQVTDVLFDQGIAPREAIETCLRQSAKMQTNASHPLGCLIVLAASNCGPASREVVKVLENERSRNRQAILARVERAVATGDLPKDMDAESFAALFNTFLLGLSSAARDGASHVQLERSVDHIMKLWPKQKPV